MIMDFYYGGLGKNYAWGLASETPIVIYVKKDDGSKFLAFKSLAEAKEYEGVANAEIYIWSARTGNWEECQFLVLENKPSSAIGFVNPN
jgi:hypothetical protein